jgi:tetratricopeptide (TPR) repeat protein
LTLAGPIWLLLGLWAWQSQEIVSKSEQAKQLMAAGKFEEAIALYNYILRELPGNPGMLLNLALAEHMAGHERECIPHFEAVLKTQPALVPALISLAAARLALNQPGQAIAPLQKAIAADPRNTDARGLLAGALAGVGRFELAAEQYRQLSELSPGDPHAWYSLGAAYESISRDAFDRLQMLSPKSPFIGALVADARVQRQQYPQAIRLYKDVLKQLPTLHGLHAALAEVHRKTGNTDEAATEDSRERMMPQADCAAHRTECQFLAGHDLEALHGDALSAEDLYWRAKAANELALQAFFRLSQLPPSVESHQLQAEIARERNQHMESVKEWRAALELSPGNPRLQQELAISLFLAKDYKAALETALPLLKLNPREPELNFIIGDSFLRLEQPEKAVHYLKSALSADPKLRAADASLGLALARLGNFAEAIRHLESALDSDDDGSLHYQLARAYQATGATEKARAAMAAYQEILNRH